MSTKKSKNKSEKQTTRTNKTKKGREERDCAQKRLCLTHDPEEKTETQKKKEKIMGNKKNHVHAEKTKKKLKLKKNKKTKCGEIKTYKKQGQKKLRKDIWNTTKQTNKKQSLPAITHNIIGYDLQCP